MKLISVVTPCYKEEGNVTEIYKRVRDVFGKFSNYNYEHIFIDNASSDKTVDVLRKIVQNDANVKVIINTRNFGAVRSAHYGLMQASGDAVILVCADLQDPPELIGDFIKKWEEGYKVVVGIKNKSEESFVLFALRKAYYNLIERLSEIELIKNFTGFGLYDRKVIDTLRKIDDPYPYFRGLICDLGFSRAEIKYTQPKRKQGVAKGGFYTLYDIAMLGITNHSKIPLRLATFTGFTVSIISLLIGLFYLIYKLIFFEVFDVGMAPVVVGLFFFSAVQLIFIGIIGEYIGSIHTQVLKRPLVIEKERINF